MTWYKDGIFFKCKKCSGCCTGFEGFVWITKEDIFKISNFLKITELEFLKKYTRYVGKKISLIEIGNNFDCIFLKNKKCQIYNIRPKQCKTFPFWTELLKSKKAFYENTKSCPGCLETNKKISFEEIEKIVK